MRQFPIRLDDQIKTVPWEMLAEHADQVQANHAIPLESLAGLGGLTPQEAVAILEDREWHRMPCTGATLRLKELVDEWKGIHTPALALVEAQEDHRERVFDGTKNLVWAGEVDETVLDVRCLLPAQMMSPAHTRTFGALELAKSMRDGRRSATRHNWNELITALEGVLEMTR